MSHEPNLTTHKQVRESLDTSEMWFHRRLVKIPWTYKMSNQNVLEKYETTSHTSERDSHRVLATLWEAETGTWWQLERLGKVEQGGKRENKCWIDFAKSWSDESTSADTWGRRSRIVRKHDRPGQSTRHLMMMFIFMFILSWYYST